MYKPGYDFIRPRKVKHVKFFRAQALKTLEEEVNKFADSDPNRKILGVRLTPWDCKQLGTYLIATVTYLEDSNGIDYSSYDDEEDSD